MNEGEDVEIRGSRKKLVVGIVVAVIVIIIVIAGLGVIIFEEPNGDPPEFLSPFSPKIVIDHENNIHYFWFGSPAVSIYYSKLDSNGDIVIEPKKIIIPPRMESLRVNIDEEDNIHLVYGNHEIPYAKYSKLDSNGSILINNVNATDIVAFPNLPVIRCANNELLYLGDNGTVDSTGNLHIINYKLIIEDGNTTGYNLSYRKYHSNGTVLIDKIIENNYSMQYTQQIAVDKNDNIHVFYMKFNDLYHGILDDQGVFIQNMTIIDADNYNVGKYAFALSDDYLVISERMYLPHNSTSGHCWYFIAMDLDGTVVNEIDGIFDPKVTSSCIISDSEGNFHIATISNEEISYEKFDSLGNAQLERIIVYP